MTDLSHCHTFEWTIRGLQLKLSKANLEAHQCFVNLWFPSPLQWSARTNRQTVRVRPGDRPVSDARFVVLIEKDRVDQAGDGVLVGEDALRALKFARSTVIRSAVCAATGPKLGSCSGQTPSKAERKPWSGARSMAPMTSSPRRGIRRRARSQSTWPTTTKCAAPSPNGTRHGPSSTSLSVRSWNRERRVVARPEATTRCFDTRYLAIALASQPHQFVLNCTNSRGFRCDRDECLKC